MQHAAGLSQRITVIFHLNVQRTKKTSRKDNEAQLCHQWSAAQLHRLPLHQPLVPSKPKHYSTPIKAIPPMPLQRLC